MDEFQFAGIDVNKQFLFRQVPSKLAWNMSRVEINDNKFSSEIPTATGIESWSSFRRTTISSQAKFKSR